MADLYRGNRVRLRCQGRVRPRMRSTSSFGDATRHSRREDAKKRMTMIRRRRIYYQSEMYDKSNKNNVKKNGETSTYCSWPRRRGLGSPGIHRTFSGCRCTFRPSSGTRCCGILRGRRRIIQRHTMGNKEMERKSIRWTIE